MSLVWKRCVIGRDASCVLYHDCEGELQAHHVVTQQHLRKRGLSEHAWDRRIGVTVCERGHRRHHAALERIPVDCLPNEVVDFVTELGLDWYLERYYESPHPGLPPSPQARKAPVGSPGSPNMRERTFRRGVRYLA